MNVLEFKFEPSPESNDHQIRILIDGNDFLEKDYLGLDPPEFFRQDSLFENGDLLIGRCDCGCVGCCDFPVTMRIENEQVIWTTYEKFELIFDRTTYFKILEETSKDYSWEDLNRKVERLVSKIFDKTQVENNYSFDWASARIEPKIIKLSYSKKGGQKLYQFSWDGKTLENAIENAQLFYQTLLKLK